MRKHKRKYKLNSRFYKMLAIIIAVIVVLSGPKVTHLLTNFFRGLNADNNILVSTATPGVTRVADDSTMNSYKQALINDENGSRYAGRVWTDKSVFAYGQDSEADGVTFKDNILSFGSDENQNKWQVETSDDFLHVFSALSSSQQMIWKQHAPLDIVLVLDLSGSMGDAVQNSQSRIEVAAEAVNTLLENISDMSDARVGLQVFSSYGSGYAGFQTVLPLDTYIKDGGNDYLSVSRQGWFSTTYNVTVRARSSSNNDVVNQRISSTGGTATQMGIYGGMNLLANASDTSVVGFDGTVSYRTPVMILITDGVPTYMSSENWWEPSITSSRMQYGSGSDNDAGLNFATMLTAAYMKKVVNEHYFGNVNGINGQAAKFYTISVDAAEEDKDIMQTTFDPKTNWRSGSPMATTLAGYWDQYQANGGAFDVPVCSSSSNCRNTSSTYSIKHPDTAIDLEENDIRYNDAFYDASSSDLSNIFGGIMESLAGEVFDPVSGNNSAGAADSVTFADPIGLYMEVKDKAIAVNNPVSNSENVDDGKGVYDMALLLYDEMHGLVKTAIYDASFIKKKGLDFQKGWYDKNGDYLSNQDGGDWSNGDTYYLDRDTAVEYVPTIPVDTGESDDLNYIRYVLYRFAEPYTQRNANRTNPNYGDTELTYKLSDIRVWVEESGNYVGQEGMDIPGTGYDSMLYVNIPSIALPVQVAKITLDSDGEILTYDSNIKNAKQSLPLRIFYSVGVRDDILTEDMLDIDIAKVSQEYIGKNKTSNGNLRFLPNYWSNNTYDAYGNNKEYSRGDVALSFSPSDSNRYYLFQDNLTLYKNAYYVDSSGEVSRITDLDSYQTKPLGNIYQGTSTGNNIPGSVKSQIEDDIRSGKLARDSVVILSGDVVTRASDYSDNQAYYIVDTYYVPAADGAGKKVSIVIGRLGKNLSQGSIAASTHLCWKDENGVSKDVYDFNDYPSTSSGENWVLSTKKGALRVGNLSENIRAKATNKSATATNYYLPTITLQKDNSIVVNNYLGNNGSLEVSDTLLMITKELEGVLESNEDDSFNFEVNIKGKEGEYQGIVLKRHETEYGSHWDYVIDNVKAVVNVDGFLLKPNGDFAETTYQGQTVYLKVTDDYEYSSDFSVQATEDLSDENQRFYVNVDYYQDTTVDPSNQKLNDTPQKAYIWKTSIGADHNGDENDFGEDFQTASTYKTRTLKFGYTAETKEKLEAGDGYPSGWTEADKALEPNTAEFTLAPDEGLLINGIASGSDYTVKEKITTDQTLAGVNFKQVVQKMNSSTKTYDYESSSTANDPGNGDGFKKNEATADKEYMVFGDTGSNIEEVHFTNYDKLKHLTISKGLQPEDGTIVTDYDKTVSFDFAISFQELSGDPLKATIKYTIYNNDNSIATPTETLVLEGTPNEQFEFKLKANQFIAFDDLPLKTGYQYQMIEKPHDGYESQNEVINGRVEADSNGVMPQTVRNTKLVPKTHVNLEGTKTLIGDELKGEEFAFTITPDALNPEEDPIGEGKTVKNAADGKITFFDDDFTKDGTYNYKIKEQKLDENDIVYDTKEYDVTVTITEDGEEKLWNTVEVTSNGVKADNITFKNIRVNEEVSVIGTKELIGGTITDRAFSFEVTPQPGNPDGDIVKDTTVYNDALGKIDVLNGTYNNIGTYNYHVKEIVPADVGSIIYDKTEYDIKVVIKLDENNTVVSSVDITSNKEKVEEITFKNINVNEKVTLTGNKYLTGGDLAKDAFSFTITPDITNPSEDPVKTTTVKNDQDGLITFIDNVYTKVGEYRYHIVEDDTNPQDGIVYDKTSYDVKVTIKQSGDDITSEVEIMNGESKTPVIEFTNYVISEEITLNGVKHLAGKTLDNEAFSFQVIPDEDNPKGDVITDTVTVKNDAAGNIHFLNGKYTGIGTYKYEIKEVIPSDKQNIKYDETIYNVEVNVNIADGHVSNSILIKVDGDEKGSISFNNAYQEAKVKVDGTKTLVGRDLANKEFTFIVTPNGGNSSGDIISGPVSVKNDATGKINFLDGVYHQQGTYKYEIKEDLSSKLSGIEYDKSVYDVTVVIKEALDGTLTSDISITKDTHEAKDITFTNYYVDVPIVINGVKHLEGGDLLEGEFSFIVTPNRNNSASDIISKAETVQNDALGNITFLDGRYNEVGTYSYEINEVVPPDDDSIKYDLNKYNVTITISILDGKVDKKVTITSNNENKQKIEFINFVKSIEVNLDGKKEFKGGTLKGDDFTFEIIPQEDNPSDDPVKQTTILNDELGNIPLIHTTYTKTGLYKYQVKEVVGKTRNIKYDNNVYEVEVLIENDDNGLLKSTITIKNDEDEVDALTFTNIKTTDSPKTLDDIVKYFIILVTAVVMIGGAIIVYRKNIR